MNNADLIKSFYQSFARGDIEKMVSCYHTNIIFKDPAFGELKGDDARDMWRMLMERSKGDLIITYEQVKADDKTGSANWTATYIFNQTGRKVVNKIAAEFEFKDGKIIKHIDYFDIWKWSQQALGLKGYLLGWTTFMKHRIQKQTNYLLKTYISIHR